MRSGSKLRNEAYSIHVSDDSLPLTGCLRELREASAFPWQLMIGSSLDLYSRGSLWNKFLEGMLNIWTSSVILLVCGRAVLVEEKQGQDFCSFFCARFGNRLR